MPTIAPMGNPVEMPTVSPQSPSEGFRQWGDNIREGDYQISDILGQDYSEDALQDLLIQFRTLLKDDENEKKEMLAKEIQDRKNKMLEIQPVFNFENSRF